MSNTTRVKRKRSSSSLCMTMEPMKKPMPAFTSKADMPILPNIDSECLTANGALEHAKHVKGRIEEILSHLDWNGSYILQAGHNLELLQEGYVVQEIIISLSEDIAPSFTRDFIINKFQPVCDPFLAVVNTPNNSFLVPCIGTQIQERFFGGKLSEQVDAGEPRSGGAGLGNCNILGNSGGGISGRGGGDAGGADQPLEANRGPSPGDDEIISTGSSVVDERLVQPGHGLINIPFQSVLRQDGKPMFDITGSLVIEVEHNEEAKHRPTQLNSKWSSPWVSVAIDELQVTSTSYTLALLETRIAATATVCPFFLRHRPTCDSEQNAQSRNDRTKTFTIHTTLGLNPSVQIGSTSTQTTSSEQNQPRWITFFQPLIDPEAGQLWKYVHNDAMDGSSRHQFTNPACVLFGRGRQKDNSWPKLDSEVVVCWSSVKSKSPGLFRTLFRPASEPAQYTTILHRVHVSLDLKDFEMSDARSARKSTCDDYTFTHGPPSSLLQVVESRKTKHEVQYDSSCVKASRNVVIQRSGYGRRMDRLNLDVMSGSNSILSEFRGRAHCD